MGPKVEEKLDAPKCETKKKKKKKVGGGDAANNRVRNSRKRAKFSAKNWKLNSPGKIRPSERGGTGWTRGAARNSAFRKERRTLNYYKIIIRVLLNARSDDFAKNIIQQSLDFLKRYERKRKARRSPKEGTRSAGGSANETAENPKEDEDWLPAAQKSVRSTCEGGDDSRKIDPYEFADPQEDDGKKSGDPKNVEAKRTSDPKKPKAGDFRRILGPGPKTPPRVLEIPGDVPAGRARPGNRPARTAAPRREVGGGYSPLELQECSGAKNGSAKPDSDRRAPNPEKLAAVPGFSTYSIPVTLEILLTEKLFRGENRPRNLRQSKITRYFGPAPKCRTRSLPTIRSDVVLEAPGRKIDLQKRYKLKKPRLSVARDNFLYGSGTRGQDPDQVIEDDTSEGTSCVPPSRSSDPSLQDKAMVNGTLDTQQREDLLAPWEADDIIEKVQRWHEDSFSSL